MFLDNNHILSCTESQAIGKEYCIAVGFGSFSSYDKQVLVYHKKHIKPMQLKDVGQKMILYYMRADRAVLASDSFILDSFLQAFFLFDAFNETTGEKYAFLYKKTEKEVEALATLLHSLTITSIYIRYEQGIAKVSASTPLPKFSTEGMDSLQIASFLFGLALIYGTFQVKGGVLQPVKIHLPLVGTFKILYDALQTLQMFCFSQGLFFSLTKGEMHDGIILQVVIPDRELLANFVSWHKALETITKISTKDQAIYHRNLLQKYIEVNGGEASLLLVPVRKILERS